MAVTRNNKQINVTLGEQTLNELKELVENLNLIGCCNRSVTIAIAVHQFYIQHNKKTSQLK